MKKILLIILIVVVIIIAGISFKGAASSGLLNSKDFMFKYNDTPDAILIDVRTPAEFNLGHIQGAVNIDYENVNFENEIKKLDTSKTYFIYCRSGNRSSKSAIIMKNNGINNIYDLQGGISDSPELLK